MLPMPAVRNVDGLYYLNGGYEVSEAGLLLMGGVQFDYQRDRSGIEHLFAQGPITEPLIFEVNCPV